MSTQIPRILVIEDEPQLRAFVTTVLREEGFAVVAAADAPEAFQTIDGPDKISLVITDVRIPGYVDGALFANVVTAYRPNLPIVVMSGFSEPEEGALPEGSLFLPKPFTSAELVSVVERVLSMEPVRRQLSDPN